jgi:hypothetical protein
MRHKCRSATFRQAFGYRDAGRSWFKVILRTSSRRSSLHGHARTAPYAQNVLPPPPPFLPSANSSKWHSRRWWDGLGYVRARSLANPNYRDGRHLLNHLRHDREKAVGTGDRALVEAVDRAISATQDWLHKGGDDLWFWAVKSVDEVLVREERRRQDGSATDT